MARVKVRLIGGSYRGEAHWFDPSMGNILRLAKLPDPIDFPTEAEVNGDFTVEHEDYRVDLLRYGSGHRHHFGYPVDMRLVDAMNVMWNGYRESEGRFCGRSKKKA